MSDCSGADVVLHWSSAAARHILRIRRTELVIDTEQSGDWGGAGGDETDSQVHQGQNVLIFTCISCSCCAFTLHFESKLPLTFIFNNRLLLSKYVLSNYQS